MFGLARKWAVLSASALSAATLVGVQPAQASWSHDIYRCDQGRCAWFNCRGDHHCARVSDWTVRRSRAPRDPQKVERCENGRCVVFRCSGRGDRCERVGVRNAR